MQVSKVEKIVIGISALILWAVLAAYAGAPIFSDEFLYIDAGLRRFAEPSYGNRYFHVYLQKLFVDIAPSPLFGARIFWGFLISLTAAQVYYHARTFSPHSNLLQGLLALAFFFSFPFIVEYSGEPAVDITAMAMVMVFISVYFYAVRHTEKRQLALAVLGALTFMLFKTKETTVFIFFLLLGFGFAREGHWNWKSLFEILQPLLMGFTGSILLFVILDGLILGKPFFSISPSTFNAVLKNYDFQPGFFFEPSSWYHDYFLDDLLLPFMLFILGAVRLAPSQPPQSRLLWLYPLLMAAFVTLNMLKITYGFIERFYFPALPVIAMLAPQVIDIEWPQNRRQWIWFSLLLAAAFALMLALRSAMLAYAASLQFEYTRFLDSIYYPLLLSLLLASLLWVKRFHWSAAVFPLFCIGAMLFSPLLYTHKYYFRIPKVRERYDQLMAPFAEFAGSLELHQGDVLLVSAALERELEMLSNDPNEIIGMYNFFFDGRINEDNVIIGYTPALLFKFLSSGDISLALLSAEEWHTVAGQSEISRQYFATPSADGSFYLLSKR